MSSRKDQQSLSLPSFEQVETERKRLKKSKQFKRALSSTIAVLIVVAAITVLVVTIFLPVLRISGVSMEPTLDDGNIIVLVKFGSLETGDLIALRYDGKILLKRIVGLPGDSITIDEDGNVFVNEELLDEPYVTEKSLGECDITFPYEVPAESYFVLGDQRSISIDSRSTAVGCIKDNQIIGRVVLRIWPFSQFSWIS